MASNRDRILELVKEAGIAVFGISNIQMDLLNVDEEKVTIIKRFARLVRTMKGNFVSVTPAGSSKKGNHDSKKALYEVYAQNLARLAEGAEEYGVNLSIEQEKPHPLFLCVF